MKKKALPLNSVEYPSGTFVKTSKGFFYISNPTTRYRLISARVVDSWHPHRVVETTEDALVNYKVRGKMKFRNGSLLHSISSGKIYLVEGGKRRHIQSPDALDRIGAVWNEAITVSANEINLQEEGVPLV